MTAQRLLIIMLLQQLITDLFIIIMILTILKQIAFILKWEEKDSNNQISLLIIKKQHLLLMHKTLSVNCFQIVQWFIHYAILFRINMLMSSLLVQKLLMMILQQIAVMLIYILKLMTQQEMLQSLAIKQQLFICVCKLQYLQKTELNQKDEKINIIIMFL